MSLQRKSSSPNPFCTQVSNRLKMSVKVVSSSSATCSRATISSLSTSPNALSTPPVRPSAIDSRPSTTGPMVAFQPATKSFQMLSSLIRNLSSAAICEFTSSRMASSGSQSSSLAASRK
jgi:hypothetical protein